MKPLQHSLISAHRYGGGYGDYLGFHTFIDSSKAIFASVQHRIFFHSDWGGEICGKIFGPILVNSDRVEVETNRLFEDHQVEDLGRVVPLEKWLTQVRGGSVPGRRPFRFQDIRENPAAGLARKWGGVAEDYRELLDLMDSPDRYAPGMENAKLLTHSSFGIFLAERILGETLEVNVQGGIRKVISTRSPLEDLVQARMGRIPRGSEIAERTVITKWMLGSDVRRGLVERTMKERARKSQ